MNEFYHLHGHNKQKQSDHSLNSLHSQMLYHTLLILQLPHFCGFLCFQGLSLALFFFLSSIPNAFIITHVLMDATFTSLVKTFSSEPQTHRYNFLIVISTRQWISSHCECSPTKIFPEQSLCKELRQHKSCSYPHRGPTERNLT